MKNFKAIVLFFLTGIAGLAFFISSYNKVFPLANIKFKLDKQESFILAGEFIKNNDFKIEGYKKTTVFYYLSNVALYLQEAEGAQKANELISKKNIYFYSWTTRYFKPLLKEDYYISFHPAFGNLLYFRHNLPEDASIDTIKKDGAQRLAEDFIKSQNIAIADFKLIESSEKKLKNRTDYFFEWEHKEFKVKDANFRISVEIAGNKISGFNQHLKIPENFMRNFERKYSYGIMLTVIAFLIGLLMFIFAVISLVKSAKDKAGRWVKCVIFTAVFYLILSVLSYFNNLPLLKFRYSDTLPLNVFFIISFALELMAGIVMVLPIALFFIAGDVVSREVFKKSKFTLFEKTQDDKLLQRALSQVTIVYMSAFAWLGFVTLFYLIGIKYFKFFVSLSDSEISGLNVYFPFIFPLVVTFGAALAEEFGYRLFLISFLKKYLKNDFAAILISAFSWALAHSSYPIFPIYARCVELLPLGIFLGWLFLKYGIEVTIAVHYVVNILFFAFIYKNSGMPQFFNTYLVLLLMSMLPLIIIVWFNLKNKALKKKVVLSH